MDAAYTVKVELQAKVDSLDKDIKFLKCLYDAVRIRLPFPHPASCQLEASLGSSLGCQLEGFRINRLKPVFIERCKTLHCETTEV